MGVWNENAHGDLIGRYDVFENELRFDLCGAFVESFVALDVEAGAGGS